jgi:hypothetical protein
MRNDRPLLRRSFLELPMAALIADNTEKLSRQILNFCDGINLEDHQKEPLADVLNHG